MRSRLLQKWVWRTGLGTLALVLVSVALVLVSATSAGARSSLKPIKPLAVTPGTRVLSLNPRPKNSSVASVAVSTDGKTVVVGQPGDYDDRAQIGSTPGSVYVLVRTPNSSRWHQKAVLSAPPGNVAGSGFGQAVAVSANGSEIAVGAPGASVGGHLHSGAVYVYTRSAGGWSSKSTVASLEPSDPADGKGVGGAVAISGSLVVAGNNHGAPVYLFIRRTGHWADEAQTAELAAPHAPGQCSIHVLDAFGSAVAADGQTVAIGDNSYPSARTCLTSGAVFVFKRPSGGWANTSTPTATLVAKDGQHDYLGESVALRGGTLAAGAPDEQIANFPFVGAVYVFQQPRSGWRDATESARLDPPAPLYAADLLGGTLAMISGNTIVASNAFCRYGAEACPVVYRKSAGGWQTGKGTRELVPPLSFQRGGSTPPLAAGGGTVVQVSESGHLPVVVFPVSKAAKA
jgi:hypothetical protein